MFFSLHISFCNNCKINKQDVPDLKRFQDGINVDKTFLPIDRMKIGNNMEDYFINLVEIIFLDLQ